MQEADEWGQGKGSSCVGEVRSCTPATPISTVCPATHVQTMGGFMKTFWKKKIYVPSIVGMSLIPSLEKQKQESSVNSQLAWSTECAPGHPGLQRDPLYKQKQNKKGRKDR